MPHLGISTAGSGRSRPLRMDLDTGSFSRPLVPDVGLSGVTSTTSSLLSRLERDRDREREREQRTPTFSSSSTRSEHHLKVVDINPAGEH
jgi:hypothetical protein